MSEERKHAQGGKERPQIERGINERKEGRGGTWREAIGGEKGHKWRRKKRNEERKGMAMQEREWRIEGMRKQGR